MDAMGREAGSLFDDTDPAIEAFLIAGYRKMSTAQKLERVRELTRAVQRLALMDIRRRHPDADERELSMDPNPYEVTEPELLRGLML